MTLYIQLHLLGLMLITKVFTFSQEDHPVLVKVLQAIGVSRGDNNTPEELKTTLQHVLESLVRRFDYYDGQDLNTNEAMDQYLTQLIKEGLNNPNEGRQFFESRAIAVGICGAGNKGGDFMSFAGVNLFLDEASAILHKLLKFNDGEELTLEGFQFYVERLQFIEKVLELVDVFVTSRTGSTLGVPEYPESALANLEEIPEPDFSVAGMECGGDENCGCGCAMDHPLMVIEGMEDFLNDNKTPAREYFMAVAGANNIRLEQYNGAEGPIFDGIKELAQKAWKTLTDSLKAIKELFNSNDDEKKVDDASKTGDNNKKALQAMNDTPAKINDKAAEGIVQLAESIDESGKVKGIVSQLNTPADGGKVIDALTGLMAKEATAGSELNKEFDAASKALEELKSASNTTGDETNKDVVAAAKSKVSEKTKEAKEALKNVKFALGKHAKLMDGIKKAIAGISPKIFIQAEEKKSE